MVNRSWGNEGFEGKKRRGRPNVLNNAAKIVVKKARYKIGDSTRKLSNSQQAKSRKGYEKRLFKIRDPWDGKKTLCLVCQVTPSSSPICKEVQKPFCGRGQARLSFLGECPKCTFLAAQTKKILFGGWTGSCAPGDKKLKMDHPWVYTLYLSPCHNGYRMW